MNASKQSPDFPRKRGRLPVGSRTPRCASKGTGEAPSSSSSQPSLPGSSSASSRWVRCRPCWSGGSLTRRRRRKRSRSRCFGITLSVDGSDLDDPRIVSLVRQALAYRHVDGAVVELGPARLSVHLDDYAFARANGLDYQSREPITRQRLLELERQGVSWGRTLEAAAGAAS